MHFYCKIKIYYKNLNYAQKYAFRKQFFNRMFGTIAQS